MQSGSVIVAYARCQEKFEKIGSFDAKIGSDKPYSACTMAKFLLQSTEQNREKKVTAECEGSRSIEILQ